MTPRSPYESMYRFLVTTYLLDVMDHDDLLTGWTTAAMAVGLRITS